MTRHHLRFLIVGTALAAPAGCRSALSPDDVAALRTATDRYVQTALAADWDAWAALATDSAVFLQPNGRSIHGREALRRWVTGLDGMEAFSTTVLEVGGRGDWAITRGTYALVMPAGAAPAVADTGKFVTVWRRQADGGWRISHTIWNSDRPMPPPAR